LTSHLSGRRTLAAPGPGWYALLAGLSCTLASAGSVVTPGPVSESPPAAPSLSLSDSDGGTRNHHDDCTGRSMGKPEALGRRRRSASAAVPKFTVGQSPATDLQLTEAAGPQHRLPGPGCLAGPYRQAASGRSVCTVCAGTTWL
jgi:hypothetical protein